MAKPYCSDFKIITATVYAGAQNFPTFAVNMADFNLAQLILLKKFFLL